LDPEESIGGKLGSAIAIKLFSALQETESTLLHDPHNLVVSVTRRYII
jgi:hypothetical protein